MHLAAQADRTLQDPVPSTRRAAWFALASAGLAWLFDAMDLQIFTLILFPSVSTLIGSSDTRRVAAVGGLIITCKLFAWGLGGVAYERCSSPC